MANLESIVTSLETSRKLCEAGVRGETVHVWVSPPAGPPVLHYNTPSGTTWHKSYTVIPAYTAQELLERLPLTIPSNKARELQVERYRTAVGMAWQVCYPGAQYHTNIKLVEAAALMLLWLIEQGHLNTLSN